MNETKQITKAILKVMEAVKGIDKSMTVGNGMNSYKGVPDQEVKKIIGEAMKSNGLCMIPISVKPTTKIERWEENSRIKQSIFTEVETSYLLLHESGESLEISGYGHGTDTQDKGAGKATTYALKYALLYTFLVPTIKIDDTDATHSDELPTPQTDNRKWLNKWTSKEQKETTKEWKNANEKLMGGSITVEDIEKHYKLSAQIKEELKSIKP
jgi:hypothetical protein